MGILAQGPEVHCGRPGKHDKHTNTTNTVIINAWCDGNPPLEPFVELTVRVPLDHWRDQSWTHERALKFLGLRGLGVLVDAMGEKDTAMVLRVRTTDRDAVYPVLPRMRGRTGLTVVTDAPQEVYDEG